MPAENREADVSAALRELGPDGGTLETVAARAGLSPKATRRHLENLVAAGVARGETEKEPPFRRKWRLR